MRVHADHIDGVPPTNAAGPPLSGARSEVVAALIPSIEIRGSFQNAPHPVAAVADDFIRSSELNFGMSNTSPAMANMLRRIICTEVPTMAIDRVIIHRNDGVVLDEMLAHRLGLCPIAVDHPERFEFVTSADDIPAPNQPDGKYAIKFTLDVELPMHSSDPTAPSTISVLSDHLRWVPLPGQDPAAGYRPVQSGILLAKLGRGQGIKLECYAVKGIGLLHNKWSPVSACFYDMKTSVTLSKKITGDDAVALKKICPLKVFGLETINDETVAVVVNPTACTLCRECLRQPQKYEDSVVITKDTTSVIFTVESLWHYRDPFQIVRAALKLFAERCRSLAKDVDRTSLKEVKSAAGDGRRRKAADAPPPNDDEAVDDD